MIYLTVNLSDLSSAANTYVAVPTTCRLVDAYSALTTVLTTADTTLTFSDGTTTIGTITITQSGCAVSDVDRMSYSADVELNTSTDLKIAICGSSGAGACRLTLVFNEFASA